MDRTWWRQWEAELESPGVSPRAVAAMRAQPGFHAALEHSLRGALTLSDSEEQFHRIMSDTACMLMGVTALHLDATGGLTHRRLREAAGFTGVLSAGRISALLMRMQMIGYVYAPRSHAPGMPKVYRPTPGMTATFKSRFRLDLEAVRRMAPGTDDILERYDTPEGFRAFMGVYGAILLGAVREGRRRPEPILSIGARRAGGVMLFALLEAAADAAGRFPAPGPATLTITSLSRRFRISRAHVLALLQKAAEADFFTRGAAEGEGEVRPALIEAMETAYAALFIGMAACAYRALADKPAVAAA